MHQNSQDTQNKKFIETQMGFPKTYMDLIEKVGSAGKYQQNLFYIFILVFICTGTILMSSSFIFMNNQYACQDQGLLVTSCKKNVCEITNQSQRLIYFTKNKEKIQSIATDYGPFICEDEYLLDMIKSFPYFGSLIGFILAALTSDKMGRKLTMSVSLAIAALGSLLMSIGFNLWMISIGVIMAGAGINVCSAICFIYLGEVVESVKRQKYSILIQISYTFGTMFLTGLYYLTGQWRINTIILQTVPLSLTFFFFTFYVEDTPLYLLKLSNEKTLKVFNRIGYINYGIKDILTEKDLQSVRSQQSGKKDQNNFQISPLDLFKFASLRRTTILSCGLGYVVLTMYYGPALIIDSIGFNTYVSSFAIQFSELIGSSISFYFIDRVKRRITGFYLLLASATCSLILVIFEKPQNCDGCIESVIEVIVIFIFRLVIGMYFTLFLVYIVEIFPTRAVGIGVNAINIAGTVATTLGPVILGSLERLEFNLMIFFFFLGIIGAAITLLLQETHNKPIEPEIQQIVLAKNLSKQSNLLEKN